MTQTLRARSMIGRATEYFRKLQPEICTALEKADGSARFVPTLWEHPFSGGGDSRVIQHGALFEKGGVNFSAVESPLNELLAGRLGVKPQRVHAAGISLILHPESPMIPTVHFNLRYLELEDGDGWFGGGIDLTPYYLFEDDVVHFHSTLKAACDRFDPHRYPDFKRRCDSYFQVKHRNEARGVGGIFFDYLRDDPDRTFDFVESVGASFLPSYLPLVERRKSAPWGAHEKEWQLHRRGRYVEFNLVYDRGTLFGLETGGRPESILLSLPPSASWDPAFRVEPGSREAKLVDVLRTPKDWVTL